LHGIEFKEGVVVVINLGLRVVKIAAWKRLEFVTSDHSPQLVLFTFLSKLK
jgi:hypothetical protein